MSSTSFPSLATPLALSAHVFLTDYRPSRLAHNQRDLSPSIARGQARSASPRSRRLPSFSRSSSSPLSFAPFPLPDPTFGLSTWTASSLPAETTVISLPFELAVTPELAEEAILSLLAPVGGEEEIKKLEERVKVLVYLMLHWIGDDEGEQIE